MTQSRLPDFILVGAPRCATTWLHECLEEHPEVFLPDCKELNFFCVNHWGNDYTRHGLPYYTSFFDKASDGQILGDISPNNMWDTESATRIHHAIPNAKILFLLRNPIDRAWSHYNYITNRSVKYPHTFDEVIDGQWQSSGVIDQGFYAKQIRPYLRIFPQRQLLTILHEEIKTAPEKTFDQICTFIGATPGVRPKHLHTRRNRPYGQRIPGLYELNRTIARTLSQLGLDSVRQAVKKTGAPSLLKRLNRRSVSSLELTKSQRRALAALYEDDIAELSSLLGRDLSDWLER